MAFLDISSQTQDQSGSGGQVAGTGSPAAPTVSGAGGSDVGGVSTAGVGAGGTGGWTNIQAYLNANQGDTGSAQNLTNSVGSQFGNEKSQLQGQSNQAMSGAKNYVDSTNVPNAQADSWVNQAAQQYNFPGSTDTKGGYAANPTSGTGAFSGTPQSKATPDGPDYTVAPADGKTGYQTIVDKANNAINGQWQGPSSFAYGLSGKTQEYGNDLNNDQAFKNYMSSIYSQKAGTPLTSGQSALQDQLDTNSQPLSQARSNLQGQYGDLQNQVGQVSQDTNNALNNYQNQFHTNQNALKSYFGDQSTKYNNNISTDDQNARAGYNTDANTINLGLSSPIYNGNGTAGNLEDLEKNSALYNAWKGGSYGGPGSTANAFFSQVDPTLQSFYANENNKYANADDTDKRSWNSLQDFLGTGANRQQQGFKVK